MLSRAFTNSDPMFFISLLGGPAGLRSIETAVKVVADLAAKAKQIQCLEILGIMGKKLDHPLARSKVLLPWLKNTRCVELFLSRLTALG